MARARKVAPAQVPEGELVVEPTPPLIPAPEVPPPPRVRRDPVPVPVLPKTEVDIINNIVCREIADPSNLEIDEDPSLSLLNRLITGITTGADLSPIENEVRTILNHSPEKQAVILAVLRSHDYFRVNQWSMVRDDHERRIWKASKRGDITTTESMALVHAANTQVKDFTKVEAAAPVAQVDGGAVEKMNPAAGDVDKRLAEIYKDTTPHGREIIRKRLYTLKQKVKAEGLTQSEPPPSAAE